MRLWKALKYWWTERKARKAAERRMAETHQDWNGLH